jgi:hypothetical protein
MRRVPQDTKKVVAKAIKAIFLSLFIVSIGGLFFIGGIQLMNTI